MSTIVYDSTLCHHGIKGQKWGVRRFQNKDGSLIKSGKKRYEIIGIDNENRKVDTRKDSFVIKKGSQLHRSTFNNSENNSGHAFASFKNKDAYGYAKRNKIFSGSKQVYDMTMVAKTDLISPSRKERVKTFVNLMLKDPEFQKAYHTQKQVYSMVESKTFKEQEKLITDIKAIEREYSMFSVALGGSEKLRSKYFSELNKKGYNMVIDDADAGIISNSPVIVFDRGNSLEVVSVSPVTRDYLKSLKG